MSSQWNLNTRFNKNNRQTAWGFQRNQNDRNFANPGIQKSINSFINKVNIKKSSAKNIYLLSESYNFNFLKSLPRLFLITTNNSTATFNTIVLSRISIIISQLLQTNPKILEYHLNIDDEFNVLGKLEQMCQGEDFIVTEKELPFLRIIVNELNLTCFSENLKFHLFSEQSFYHSNSKASQFKTTVNITSYLREFIKIDQYQKFTIQTKKSEYKCNIFGILASAEICDFISKNPEANFYFYDYEDDQNEFQNICDLFNFQTITLSNENVFSMNEIGQDLKIEFISEDIDGFIENIEKVSKAIDDQQIIIDKIDELYDCLYNIKEKKVDFVSEIIIESDWSKSEENVIELAAFIIQVVLTDIRLHPYLIDLLVKLDENSNDDENNLKILIPFIRRHSLKLIKENELFVPFVFMMFKRGLITQQDLINNLTKINTDDKFYSSWFYPELIKYCDKQINQKYLYPPANMKEIDEYIKMRDKGEFDDVIASALRNDDVDKFQSIVSKSAKKSLLKSVPRNMFDQMFSADAKYINYAAAYGSIKCFKYLLLNDVKIDETTFEMAIVGGNIELIRIVDNERLGNFSTKMEFDFSKSSKQSIILKALIQAIKRHKNDIFDWILEQKLSMLNVSNCFHTLINCSIENNNAHTLVQLIDNGYNFHNSSEKYQSFLEKSSERGYYLLTKLLLRMMEKNKDYVFTFKPKSSISFGNISILKLFEDKMDQKNLENMLLFAIGDNLLSFTKYFFEVLVHKNFELNQSNSTDFLCKAIRNKSSETLDYLINKINELCPISLSSLQVSLSACLEISNLEFTKKIANLIHLKSPDYNFTNPFLKAVSTNLKDFVEYFIDNKYFLDYYDICETLSTKGLTNAEIFEIIMNNADSENQKTMIKCIDIVINRQNKPLIKYLLSKDALSKTSLIEAVKTNDLEIVEMILEKNSSPSYLNSQSKFGTALYLSVLANNYPIFEKLISMPGIDPSIYFKNYKTPLVLSVMSPNIQMFNAIIDFYGDKIKDQKWQIEKSLQVIISDYTNIRKYESIQFEQILKRIIELNIIDINYKFQSKTLLFYLIEHNMIDIIETLLKDDSIDFNCYEPTNGNTPLIVAIKQKNRTLSKLLIENHKIDINLKNYNDKTALNFAIKFQLQEIVDLLINNEKFKIEENDINLAFFNSNSFQAKKFLAFESLDVNFIPNKKAKLVSMDYKIKDQEMYQTQLISSIKSNDNELFDLITHHKSFGYYNYRSKMHLFSALFYSIKSNKIYYFNKLLKSTDKIDINSSIFESNSLLNSCITMNINNEFISSILNYPTFNSEKSDISKAFSYCLLNSNRNDKAKLLYEYDCKHDHLIDKYIGENGSNLLIDVVKGIVGSTDAILFLLNHGVDPNKPNSNNEYPFIMSLNKEAVSSLLIKSNKIDFNMKIQNQSEESKETSYLHMLVNLNKTDLLKDILSRKLCDINITNDLGETPLFEACKKHYIEIVKLLFTFDDLDFKHKNKNGEDAIQISRKMMFFKSSTKNENENDKKEEENIEINDKNEYLSKLLDLLTAKNVFTNNNNNKGFRSLQDAFLRNKELEKVNKIEIGNEPKNDSIKEQMFQTKQNELIEKNNKETKNEKTIDSSFKKPGNTWFSFQSSSQNRETKIKTTSSSFSSNSNNQKTEMKHFSLFSFDQNKQKQTEKSSFQKSFETNNNNKEKLSSSFTHPDSNNQKQPTSSSFAFSLNSNNQKNDNLSDFNQKQQQIPSISPLDLKDQKPKESNSDNKKDDTTPSFGFNFRTNNQKQTKEKEKEDEK